MPGVPLRAANFMQAGEPPAMANANLRSAEHQKRVGKARCCGTIDFEMSNCELLRAQFNGGQILDVDGAVASETRSHGQGYVVPPRYKWLLEGSIAAKGQPVISFVSMSVSQHPPALAIRSASPVVSTTTLANTA
jgi:hypothetical protein